MRQTAEARPMIPPIRFIAIDNVPIQQEISSYAVQVGELAHRFEILAFVLAKRPISWRATCDVGGIRCEFSSMLDSAVGRKINLEARLPVAVPTMPAPQKTVAELQHWIFEKFIEKAVVRLGTHQAKALKRLLDSLGSFVPAHDLSQTIGIPSNPNESVTPSLSSMLSGLKKKVEATEDANLRMVSTGTGLYKNGNQANARRRDVIGTQGSIAVNQMRQ